eukprot:56649-Rhodomonas_salina.1
MGSPALPPVPQCQLRARLRPEQAGCLPHPARGWAGSFSFSAFLVSYMVARPAIAMQTPAPRMQLKCFFSMSSYSR